MENTVVRKRRTNPKSNSPYQTISLFVSLQPVRSVPVDELLNAGLLVHPNVIYQNATAAYVWTTFQHANRQSCDAILFRADKRAETKNNEGTIRNVKIQTLFVRVASDFDQIIPCPRYDA